MAKIVAFVGHSFDEKDNEIVNKFLRFLDSHEKVNAEFSWDHAIAAEPKGVAKKVIEKMRDKNLFIGICTAKEYAIASSALKKTLLGRSYNVKEEYMRPKTSDWIIQEIGYAIA